MIVWPMLYMVDYSFHRKLPPSRRGGPDDVYSLENYWYFVYGSTRVFTSYNWVHINAFWQTIAVSVVVETLKQIEAQLMMRNYEGFIR